MRVLLLGSSGFLGAYVGYSLSALGWEVGGIARSSHPGINPSHLIDDASEVEALIRHHSCDVVINCIAMASHEACESDPEAAQEINARLPGKWAEAARSIGAQFVYISTDAVFDGESDHLYSESDPTHPGSVYGASKRAGEQAVLQADPEALVFRANFFGWSENSSKGILDFFVNAMSEGKNVQGFRDYEVSSLYMGDLCDAIVELLSVNAHGLFHAVASSTLSKYEFGLAVAKAGHLDAAYIQPGSLRENEGLSNRGAHLGLSVDKIEHILGRAMPTTVQGLGRAFEERQAVMDYLGGRTRSGETS